jgi:hypothetical protein
MNIPTEIRKWVAIGALIVVLLLAGTVLTMCQGRREAATARAEGKVASGQADAGNAAVGAIDGQMKAQGELEAQERINQGNILNALDAKTDAGETGNAGRAALCANDGLRRQYPAYCRSGL